MSRSRRTSSRPVTISMVIPFAISQSTANLLLAYCGSCVVKGMNPDTYKRFQKALAERDGCNPSRIRSKDIDMDLGDAAENYYDEHLVGAMDFAVSVLSNSELLKTAKVDLFDIAQVADDGNVPDNLMAEFSKMNRQQISTLYPQIDAFHEQIVQDIEKNLAEERKEAEAEAKRREKIEANRVKEILGSTDRMVSALTNLGYKITPPKVIATPSPAKSPAKKAVRGTRR